MRYATKSRIGVVAVALLAVAAPVSVGAGPPVPPGVGVATNEPKGFWSGLACVARRVKLRCRTSNAGKFLINAVRPISKLTGGLIPVPDDNHFAAAVELHAAAPAGMAPGAEPKPPPPPPPGVAAAAKILAEKQQAKIRREAVAYLAGLDCRYYPEAEAALIASLRADRDECVRLEAAKSLAAGCCCTPATHKALMICITGSEKDGNPAERSPAVRRVALLALRRCEECGCGPGAIGVGQPPEAPLGEASPTADGVQAASHSQPIGRTAFGSLSPTDPMPAEPASLLSLWRRAQRSPNESGEDE